MRRTLTGLGAALLLALLLVGLPALLVLIAPVGLPHVQPTLQGIWAALTSPDDGTVFLTLLKAAGWVVWVLLAISVLTETIARLRHVHAPDLRGLAIPQGIARGLVAAVLALFLNTNPTIAAPDAAAHPVPAAPAQPRQAPAEAAPAKPGYERYTVKKGDILSQLALDHLGDAHRYPEIYQASRGIHQPGGRRLTDPDEIDIGWTLRIPHAHRPTKNNDHHTPAPPRQATTPSHIAEPTPVPVPLPSTPPSAPTPKPTSSAEPMGEPAPVEPVDAEVAEPDWLLAGLAGAGAILAGSLWIVLQRRRAAQQHHRRPGHVIAPPPPHLLPVEKTLRYQGRPASTLLGFIDDSLRRLALTLTTGGAPLPALTALDADPTGIRLHLAAPATLPEPWQQSPDDTVWTLEVADVPADLEPLEPDGPAPWPHLTTIGADEAGRFWLLNLEAAGAVRIGGDQEYATDLARYLAAELATNPWALDLRVDLIDTFTELAGLDPRRIRHHPAAGIDDTIADAVHTIDRLNQLRLADLAAARTTRAGDELWPSRVLVTTSTTAGHFAQLAQLIADQPGRTGVAALTVGGEDAAGRTPLEITVGSDGRVRIPALGLDLIANGMTHDEAAGCVQLLQAAERYENTDVPPAGARHGDTDKAGRLDPDLTQPRDPTGAADEAITNLPQPDADILAVAATTTDDLATLAPVVPDRAAEAMIDSDPDLDADVADWLSQTTDRPRLSVLGPVKVRLGRGGSPAEAAKRRPYYTELVAFLATQPGGATTQQLCSAFAVTPARLQRDLAVARAWLGDDPATGRRHLPEAEFEDEATRRGPRRYRLHQVLQDADLFRRLRRRGQARGTGGLADYLRALDLVSGIPYARLRDGGGVWLAEDRDDQHLVVAIVDTAHLAVTMALQLGDLATATRAARIAAMAAPDEDGPRLDLAAIALADGDTTTRDQIMDAVLQQRDADGPVELGARSIEVMNRPHR